MAQRAGVAALGLDEDYYAQIRGIYHARVDALVAAFDQIDGVTAPTPEGAFYAMVELPIDDADRFALYLATTFRHEAESVVVGTKRSDPAGMDSHGNARLHRLCGVFSHGRPGA